MSRRFRRSKPLGGNKKNMKSENDGSPKPSPVALDSAAIYDFLYVDKPRVSGLYAQLFPQGILTSVKTNAQQTFSDDSDIGTDVKVFSAKTKSTEGGSESIEHVFDASWSVPLEVLTQLAKLGKIRSSIRGAGL